MQVPEPLAIMATATSRQDFSYSSGMVGLRILGPEGSSPRDYSSIFNKLYIGTKEYSSITNQLYQIPEGIYNIKYIIKEDVTELPERIFTPSFINSLVMPINPSYCCSYANGALTSVTLLEGVTGIGQSAFKDCSGLTSVTLPSTLTTIGTTAFDGCKNLTEIFYAGTQEQWGNIVLGSSWKHSALTTIHCSDGDINL